MNKIPIIWQISIHRIHKLQKQGEPRFSIAPAKFDDRSPWTEAENGNLLNSYLDLADNIRSGTENRRRPRAKMEQGDLFQEDSDKCVEAISFFVGIKILGKGISGIR